MSLFKQEQTHCTEFLSSQMLRKSVLAQWFFLLNLTKLIHSTMPLTYLLQAGLQANDRVPGDRNLYISSTLPSATKGTSFSKSGVIQAKVYKHQALRAFVSFTWLQQDSDKAKAPTAIWLSISQQLAMYTSEPPNLNWVTVHIKNQVILPGSLHSLLGLEPAGLKSRPTLHPQGHKIWKTYPNVCGPQTTLCQPYTQLCKWHRM